VRGPKCLRSLDVVPVFHQAERMASLKLKSGNIDRSLHPETMDALRRRAGLSCRVDEPVR